MLATCSTYVHLILIVLQTLKSDSRTAQTRRGWSEVGLGPSHRIVTTMVVVVMGGGGRGGAQSGWVSEDEKLKDPFESGIVDGIV